jgi:hypothetical protein
VISLDLARALRTAGLTWAPESGDRFVVDMPDLETQTFYVSDLTVDLHEHQGKPFLGFNGTTEWAMDSVTLEQSLWLPHEHQLRSALGSAFVGLAPVEGSDGLFRVLISVDGGVLAFDDADVSVAYARALLNLLTR